ncbi:putative ribonuclease H-like domain-containing protein [Tanacetum coccineum]
MKYVKNVTEEEAEEYEKEKEELRLSLKIIFGDDSEVNYEPLSKRFPIVNWEYKLLGNVDTKDMYIYKLTRAYGSSSYHGDMQAFLRRLDMQDLNDLYSDKVPKDQGIIGEMLNFAIRSERRIVYGIDLESETIATQPKLMVRVESVHGWLTSLLKRRVLMFVSYGTGEQCENPGPSLGRPNVMIWNSVPKQIYKRNGILPMLKRNLAVKTAPQRWQENGPDGQFDVVFTFEEKVFDMVAEDLHTRDQVLLKPLEAIDRWEDVIDDVISTFERQHRRKVSMKVVCARLDRKSTTGACQFLGSRLINWQCKKQTVVANSTTEAEYTAASHCCGQNPVYHSKTKHIEIRHHFIRDSYEKRLIEMVKIHTDNNVADLLTKAFDCNGLYTSAIWIEVGRFSLDIGLLDFQFDQFCSHLNGKAVVVSESSVRRDLHLNDEDGTACLTVNEIFENLALMGYETASEKLTFYKDPKKFLMYLRFLQLFLNIQLPNLVIPFNDIYETPKLTKKVFTNMRKPGKGFSGRVTQLFQNMLAPPVVVGEGSEQPTEPQPTSSTAPQEILTQVATATASQPPKDPNTYRRTKRGRNTKVPQSGGSPKKVGDEAINEEMLDSVERDITTDASLDAAHDSDNITKTQSTKTLNEPHPQGEDSGGYTPGSDEGRLKLQELMTMCTKLSKQVLDLEKEKDAQAVEILRLKKRTNSRFHESDFDGFDDETVDAATTGVSTVSAPVTTAGTLIKMKEEKAKEKGVAFKDIEDSSRPVRSITTLQTLPSIDPKDTGKAQRKFRGAQRAAEIRSRPPTKTQLRYLMMTYLKNMGGYKHSQLKGKTYEEIQGLYEREQKFIHDFIAMDSEKEEKKSMKPESEGKKSKRLKRITGSYATQKSHKKPKVMKSVKNVTEEEAAEYEKENEELRLSLKIISGDDSEVNYEQLSRRFPIVNWEYKLLGNVDAKDMQDLNDLYSTPMEINMLVEKKYPLINELLKKMLNLQLEAEEESTMAFELIKFIKSMLEE